MGEVKVLSQRELALAKQKYASDIAAQTAQNAEFTAGAVAAGGVDHGVQRVAQDKRWAANPNRVQLERPVNYKKLKPQGVHGMPAFGKVVTKFVPYALAADLGYSAYDGYDSADEIYSTENPGLAQKMAGAAGGVVESVSFGTIPKETTAKLLYE